MVQQGILSHTQEKKATRVGAGAQSYLAYFYIPSLSQFKCQVTKHKMLEKSFSSFKIGLNKISINGSCDMF